MKKGKTTRILDRCVQELFTKGITYIYESRTDENVNKLLHEKFIARLELEHPKAKYVSHFKTYDGIPCYKVEIHNL
jgi:hypothetical protein